MLVQNSQRPPLQDDMAMQTRPSLAGQTYCNHTRRMVSYMRSPIFLIPERNIKERPTIQLMRKIAAARGGECLSPRYTNAATHLTWQCSEGHQWEASPNNIKNNGTWCPACAGVQKHTLQEMRKLAADRGGNCLSTTYTNAHSPLLWQCSKGHQWKTSPHSLLQGYWCAICSGNNKSTIEEMQKLAAARGGKCLSHEYTNTDTNLRWQCSKGHQWDAPPYRIIRGSWCSACAGKKKRTIEEMQQLAARRGGTCLSDRYTNAATHLTWQCGQGHQWQAKPSNIQQGRWCPICARSQK